MNFEDMESTSPAPEPLLAEWHCDAALWRQFKGVERFDAQSDRVRNMGIVSLVLTPPLLFLTWLGYSRGVYGYKVFQTTAVIVSMGFVLALAGLTQWYFRRRTAAAMDTPTGEVVLRLDGFIMNGEAFEWRFGPKGVRWGGGWRFQSCKRQTVAGLEMLEFICAITTIANGGSHIENYVHKRVPVPQDRIAEADGIVERLNLRFRSAEDERQVATAEL
ncbi:MAG: hypothetical protein ACJ73D_08550 [Pyrinomonadaceae bacterium]